MVDTTFQLDIAPVGSGGSSQIQGVYASQVAYAHSFSPNAIVPPSVMVGYQFYEPTSRTSFVGTAQGYIPLKSPEGLAVVKSESEKFQAFAGQYSADQARLAEEAKRFAPIPMMSFEGGEIQTSTGKLFLAPGASYKEAASGVTYFGVKEGIDSIKPSVVSPDGASIPRDLFGREVYAVASSDYGFKEAKLKYFLVDEKQYFPSPVRPGGTYFVSSEVGPSGLTVSEMRIVKGLQEREADISSFVSRTPFLREYEAGTDVLSLKAGEIPIVGGFTGAFASSFIGIFKPTTYLRAGSLVLGFGEAVVSEPTQAFKRLSKGADVAGGLVVTAVKEKPVETAGSVLGLAAGAFVVGKAASFAKGKLFKPTEISGLKPTDFVYKKQASEPQTQFLGPSYRPRIVEIREPPSVTFLDKLPPQSTPPKSISEIFAESKLQGTQRFTGGYVQPLKSDVTKLFEQKPPYLSPDGASLSFREAQVLSKPKPVVLSPKGASINFEAKPPEMPKQLSFDALKVTRADTRAFFESRAGTGTTQILLTKPKSITFEKTVELSVSKPRVISVSEPKTVLKTVPIQASKQVQLQTTKPLLVFAPKPVSLVRQQVVQLPLEQYIARQYAKSEQLFIERSSLIPKVISKEQVIQKERGKLIVSPIYKPLQTERVLERVIVKPKEVEQTLEKTVATEKTSLLQFTPQVASQVTPKVVPQVIQTQRVVWPPTQPSKLVERKRVFGGRRLRPGYRAFVKRRGKWLPVSPVLSKGEAVRRGERVALETLAASFKVRPSGSVVEDAGVSEYRPSSVFRGFKVRGRARIPLQDEFIQRRGLRLASFGERMELKTSKRRRFF